MFGELLGALTGRKVYTIYAHGEPLVETTSLGAAIVGKAACLGLHPYEIGLTGLGIEYGESKALGPDIFRLLTNYKTKYFELADNFSAKRS